MQSYTLVITLLVIISIAIMECSGNPNPEQHGEAGEVANAIRYLQDLERIARPRFGKRGNSNGYLNKEYADYNVLRYLLQNPELIQSERES